MSLKLESIKLIAIILLGITTIIITIYLYITKHQLYYNDWFNAISASIICLIIIYLANIIEEP